MSFNTEVSRRRAPDAVMDGADWWLAQMARPECELLTSDEEYALAVRAKAGSPGAGCEGPTTRDAAWAREQLITHNLRLVIGIARRYMGLNGARLDDLINEGNIGLMRAAGKFNPARGFKFSTMATWWIRQACQRHTDGCGPIAMPSYVRQAQRNLVRERRLAEIEEREPTDEELRATLGISIEVWDALQRPLTACSLDAPMRGEYSEEPDTLLDVLEDGESSVEQAVADRDDRDGALGTVWALFDKAHLTKREQQVMALRYAGGEDGGELVLEKCGKVLGITRERVRQVEAKALRKLRLAAGIYPPVAGVADVAVEQAELWAAS